MHDVECAHLIEEAMKAREFAWAPYSSFRVGAALLASNGKVYRGCNIENAAFTPGNCAERTAIFKAVSEGNKSFRAIAVVGGSERGEIGYAFPCGVCRQVMMEFCSEDFAILVAKSPKEYTAHTLAELLPHGFGPSSL